MYALLLELPLVAGLHRLITEVQAPHRHAATPMTTIVVAEELERTVDELLVPTTRRVDVPVLLRLT